MFWEIPCFVTQFLISVKLEENTNIYKISIYFFFLILKQSLLNKSLAIEEIDLPNLANTIKISALGIVNVNFE
jgi:hypothetical protein